MAPATGGEKTKKGEGGKPLVTDETLLKDDNPNDLCYETLYCHFEQTFAELCEDHAQKKQILSLGRLVKMAFHCIRAQNEKIEQLDADLSELKNELNNSNDERMTLNQQLDELKNKTKETNDSAKKMEQYADTFQKIDQLSSQVKSLVDKPSESAVRAAETAADESTRTLLILPSNSADFIKSFQIDTSAPSLDQAFINGLHGKISEHEKANPNVKLPDIFRQASHGALRSIFDRLILNKPKDKPEQVFASLLFTKPEYRADFYTLCRSLNIKLKSSPVKITDKILSKVNPTLAIAESALYVVKKNGHISGYNITPTIVDSKPQLKIRVKRTDKPWKELNSHASHLPSIRPVDLIPAKYSFLLGLWADELDLHEARSSLEKEVNDLIVKRNQNRTNAQTNNRKQ